MNLRTPPTILIVDDDADFRELASLALRQSGYAVAQAGGVRSALRAVRRVRFDGIVMDGLLPEGSGIELVARLRGDGLDVPIVFVSANPDKVEVPAGPGIRFLAKPLPPLTLVEVMDRLLDRRMAPPDQASLDDLRREFGQEIGPILDRMEERLRSARKRFVEELTEVGSQAHRLRGSAGSHGFDRVGVAAGELEDVLQRVVEAYGSFEEPDWWAIMGALRRAREAT